MASLALITAFAVMQVPPRRPGRSLLVLTTKQVKLDPGVAATARTITGAAAVMVLVFGAFILSGNRIIELPGVGLAVGAGFFATHLVFAEKRNSCARQGETSFGVAAGIRPSRASAGSAAPLGSAVDRDSCSARSDEPLMARLASVGAAPSESVSAGVFAESDCPERSASSISREK